MNSPLLLVNSNQCEFLAGTPVELIMKISGLKRINDFYKYIRISLEEAANEIKELWIKKDGMRLEQEVGELFQIKMNENDFNLAIVDCQIIKS